MMMWSRLKHTKEWKHNNWVQHIAKQEQTKENVTLAFSWTRHKKYGHMAISFMSGSPLLPSLACFSGSGMSPPASVQYRSAGFGLNNLFVTWHPPSISSATHHRDSHIRAVLNHHYPTQWGTGEDRERNTQAPRCTARFHFVLLF